MIDVRRYFRTLVIEMVLCTDMSFHFQQLKNMKNLLAMPDPYVYLQCFSQTHITSLCDSVFIMSSYFKDINYLMHTNKTRD